MNKYIKILAANVLLFSIILGVGIWGYFDGTKYQEYTGRLLFSEQEYRQFKQYLADNPEIKINKATELSSSPVLVEISLTIPSNIHIPYPFTSALTSSGNNDGTVYVSIIMLGITGVGFCLFLLYRSYQDEKDDANED